jgi:S1-C subfamily serine protease
MHKLLSILLAFISLFHSPTYTQVVDKAQASVIRITGEMDVMTFFGPMHGSYSCTGEVVAPHRVLTAAHCNGDKMLADGLQVKVIAYDKYFDLMLLDVPTEKPALIFRDTPVVRYEPLTAIGYAWGLDKLTVLPERPFLFNVIPPEDPTAPKMLVTPGYVGGMSGGPVIDAAGLMVGIVQETGDGIGLGVDMTQIHAFMAGLI